ncbi:MAG: hypothetical protein IIY53_09300 [Solobacterium sp.]|nr:hypothetical protein [Solobacterium sp.]
MMTAEERVSSLHKRMDTMRKVQERRKTGAAGALSIGFASCLLFLLLAEGTAHSSGAGMYSGSALLFEGAGGYVLVAVIAFTAAVITTVLCMRYKNKNKDTHDKYNQQGRKSS